MTPENNLICITQSFYLGGKICPDSPAQATSIWTCKMEPVNKLKLPCCTVLLFIGGNMSQDSSAPAKSIWPVGNCKQVKICLLYNPFIHRWKYVSGQSCSSYKHVDRWNLEPINKLCLGFRYVVDSHTSDTLCWNSC